MATLECFFLALLNTWGFEKLEWRKGKAEKNLDIDSKTGGREKIKISNLELFSGFQKSRQSKMFNLKKIIFNFNFEISHHKLKIVSENDIFSKKKNNFVWNFLGET